MENEQETTAQEKPSETTDDIKEGAEPKTTNILEQAELIRKGLEEANKKSEELLKRQEAVAARMMLGGSTEAGSIHKTPEEVQKDEVETEASKIVGRFHR